jgi:hypothetical protein
MRFVRLDPAPIVVAAVWCAEPERDPEAGPRRMDRYAALATSAAARLWTRAEIAPPSADDPSWGIVLGSSFGCWSSNARYLDDLVTRPALELSPVLFARTVSSTINGEISIAWRIGGPSHTLVSGWSAGAEALAEAGALIHEGRADRVLAGGVEALDPTLDALHTERRREPGLDWLPPSIESGAGLCLLARADLVPTHGRFALRAYHRAHDPRSTWSLADALDGLAWPSDGRVVVSNTVPPDLLARWRTEARGVRLDGTVDERGAAGAPIALAQACEAHEDDLLIVSRAIEGATTALWIARSLGAPMLRSAHGRRAAAS